MDKNILHNGNVRPCVLRPYDVCLNSINLLTMGLMMVDASNVYVCDVRSIHTCRCMHRMCVCMCYVRTCNVLFVSIGFLSWFEAGGKGKGAMVKVLSFRGGA